MSRLGWLIHALGYGWTLFIVSGLTLIASLVFGGEVVSSSCSVLCSYTYAGPRELLMIAGWLIGAGAVVGSIIDLFQKRYIQGGLALFALLPYVALTGFWVVMKT